MKEKICIISTGGTIGSVLRHDFVAIDRGKRLLAHEFIRAKRKIGVELEIRSPLNKHSEDFTPVDWIRVLREVREACRRQVSGVIVTHGTDTLHFTAAAAVALRNLFGKRICFTGSYLPPDHVSSDVRLNLHGAIRFVSDQELPEDIYVLFRVKHSGNLVNVIRAADLKPMSFDERVFSAAYSSVLARINAETGVIRRLRGRWGDVPMLGLSQIPKEEAVSKGACEVAMLSVYPGIDRKVLEAVAKKRKVVILSAYHSGTGPSVSARGGFLDCIKDLSRNTLFLMGAVSGRYTEKPYRSTMLLREAGVKVYFDLQAHFLYSFALLGLSGGLSKSDIVSLLRFYEIK